MKKLQSLFIYSSLLLSTIGIVNAANIPEGTKLADNQSLKFYLKSNPTTLDPNISLDGPSFEIIRQLFDSLVRWDQEKGEYVNNGAESYTQSSDLKTWTFYLKKNAVWSDGKPVTAHDYVYSWRRIVDPKTGSSVSDTLSNYLNIVNAKDIVNGKLPIEDLGVKALDDYTFQVTTEKPIPWFYSSLSSLAPVRQDIIEKYGNQWTLPENIVVNGPFKLDKYIINERIDLSKNEKYYQADKVFITNISLPIITSRLSAYNRFQAKDLDIVVIPRQVFDKAVKEGHDIKTILRQVVFGLSVNANVPKLQDIRVREALRLVIDNETLVSKVIRNNNFPIYSWIPKFVTENEYVTEQKLGSIEERIKKAKKLIKEAGYSKSNPLKLNFLHNSGDIERLLFISYQDLIHKSLDGAVNVVLENLEWKVYIDRFNKKEFDVSFTGWGGGHASSYVTKYLSTSVLNENGFKSEEFDRLFEQVLDTRESKERAKLFARMNDILINSYTVIPVHQGASNFLVNPKLKGFDTKNEGIYFIDYYFIK